MLFREIKENERNLVRLKYIGSTKHELNFLC
jgi:hypothetical protein